MAAALTLLATTYAAVWFGVYELFHLFPSWWPYWICVSVALAFAMVRQYRNAGQTLLAAVGAELLETLTVSRYREFAADRGSALLTGMPGELMSALTKLSGQAAEIPHDDLRAANAFCIVSTRAQRFSLFSDHPPLEKCLATLSEIARELGKPVA